MHWLDYIIVLVPLCVVFGLAFYSKRYVRGVADFLAAGRVAGRYVISVGDMSAAMSIITVIGSGLQISARATGHAPLGYRDCRGTHGRPDSYRLS